MTCELTEMKTISFCDLRDLDGWASIDMTCGSDYSGCSAQRANYEWALDNWNKDHDIKFLCGPWGGYGVAYRITTEDPDIHEVIHCMSEHCVIDDSYLFAVEERWIQEAIDGWLLSDFKRAVESWYDGEEVFCQIGDKLAEAILQECIMLSGESWQSENAGMWIDVDRLYPHFDTALAKIDPKAI
jgi:hypothetical protein